jgi:hypothetical protein
LAFVPNEIIEMIDKNKLKIEHATAIAKKTAGLANQEEAAQIMIEQAEYISNLDKSKKNEAIEVIKEDEPGISVAEIEKKVNERKNEKEKMKTITIEMPEGRYTQLIKWGSQQGIPEKEPSIIVNHMVMRALGGD